MANTFKSNVAANIVTTGNTVYTCPAATQSVVIGLSVANKSASTVTANVYLTRSATNYVLVAGTPITPGSALVVVGSDQKVVLQAADAITVYSSTNAALDCIVSILEIS